MVLVTGASGHLGNTLIRALLGRGERVRALVLPSETTTSLDGLEVEQFEGDVLVPEDMRAAVDGVDSVFHLAGIIGIRKGMEERMRKVNVEGTRNVALAARESGVRRFVHVSSIHAIVRPEEGKPIHEGLPFDPDNPAGAYDRTKAEATLEVLGLVETGLPAVVACPTGIIGPNDFLASEMGRTISGWMRSGKHMMIDGFFDFVDVRDVAEGFISARDRGRIGETYILGGTRISLRSLHDAVQKSVGMLKPVISVPWKLARFGARLLSPFYRVIGRESPYTVYSIETVRSNSLVSIQKAKKELAYRPRNIENTIEDTVQWWKDHGRLAGRKAISGRIALVTGASSGIGAAVARRLAEKGMLVVLVARRKDRLEQLAEQIREGGGRAEVAVCDLSDSDAVEGLAQRLENEHHGVDVLVNNAGIGWYGYFWEMTDEMMNHMQAINNSALVHLTRKLLPGMVARKFGRIINIGSIAGVISGQGIALYAATKAFIDAFSVALSRELMRSGVHATVVRPGPVASEFFARGRDAASGRRRVPAERLGISPDVVARRVVSLLSRRRKVVYVPRVLSVVPLLVVLSNWILDIAGPVHLRRKVKVQV